MSPSSADPCCLSTHRRRFSALGNISKLFFLFQRIIIEAGKCSLRDSVQAHTLPPLDEHVSVSPVAHSLGDAQSRRRLTKAAERVRGGVSRQAGRGRRSLPPPGAQLVVRRRCGCVGINTWEHVHLALPARFWVCLLLRQLDLSGRVRFAQTKFLTSNLHMYNLGWFAFDVEGRC